MRRARLGTKKEKGETQEEISIQERMNAQITRPYLESNENYDSEPQKERILQKQKGHPQPALFIKN